jgi:hypothetical protein
MAALMQQPFHEYLLPLCSLLAVQQALAQDNMTGGAAGGDMSSGGA